MRKKQRYFLVFLFCIFIGYFYLSAQVDYSWGEKYLSEKKEWVVFSTQNNLIDIFYPYSIFKPPINRIGLIHKKSLKEVSNNTFYVKTLWVEKEMGIWGKTREEEFRYVLDCNKYQTGWEKGGKNLDKDNIDLNLIEWTESENDKVIESYRKECRIIKNILGVSS